MSPATDLNLGKFGSEVCQSHPVGSGLSPREVIDDPIEAAPARECSAWRTHDDDYGSPSPHETADCVLDIFLTKIVSSDDVNIAAIS